jgi:LPXTG-motif cell wall-anchored protein
MTPVRSPVAATIVAGASLRQPSALPHTGGPNPALVVVGATAMLGIGFLLRRVRP